MKIKLQKISITLVIIIILIIVNSSTLIIYSIYSTTNEKKEKTKQLYNKLNTYQKQLSESLILPLWNFDLKHTGKILESIMIDNEVQSIVIRDPYDNTVILARSREENWKITNQIPDTNNESLISSKSKINYVNDNIGLLEIYITEKFMNQRINETKKYYIKIIILLDLLLIASIFILLWIFIIKPLTKVKKYAEAVKQEKSTDIFINNKYIGELASLHATITQMVSILNEKYNISIKAFKRFKNLFEKSPVAIWEEDITEVCQYLNQLKTKNIHNLDDYITNNPNELFKILSLIKIIDINQAALKLHNAKSKAELIENITTLFKEDSLKTFKAGVINIWDNNFYFESEGIIYTLNGIKKDVIIRWTPDLSQNTERKIILVTINDISLQKSIEQKLKENEYKLKLQNEQYQILNTELLEINEQMQIINNELAQAKDKAEENDRLKTSFLSNMSHEIRTPLNGIIGFASLLQEDDSDIKQQKQFLKIISEAGHQLLDVVNDILDISKIETGQIHVNNEKIELIQILKDIAIFYKESAKQKSLNLNLSIPKQINTLWIISDELKIRQIVGNLLNNAIKFTEKGFVELGLIIENNYANIYVKDTGIGIAKNKIETVFDRFQQAETTISNKYGGSGLGLAICKGYVELLGGEIKAESEINKGSIFNILIPLNITDKNKTKTIKTKNIANLKNCKILIVEDEYNNYLYLQAILINKQVKILHAKNGKEAIEIYKRNTDIDIILMDIKMPEMDGYTATKQIKSINPKIPIIAQTAFALQEEQTKIKNHGFDAYISKPIKKIELNELLIQFYKNN